MGTFHGQLFGRTLKLKKLYIVYTSVMVWFKVISTISGYLMPNPFYTYLLNIYDLVWFSFMPYQPFQVI